jgi:hypothetical protein
VIRRNSSKYVQDQERLEQQSFTGIKGIDCSKIHTDVTTVYDMRNLDIDLDGGLKLRKPLTAVRKSTAQIYHMYNGELLQIGKGTVQSPEYTEFTLYDMYNTEHNVKGNVTGFIDCSECTVINTATSTLLYNCNVDFASIKNKYLPNESLINERVESNSQLRIVKLSSKDGVNKLEILPAEMNILTTSDIPLDYNLALSYPLAIRDNYDASAINITGIIAYAKGNSDKVTVDPVSISNITTEPVNGVYTYSGENSFNYKNVDYPFTYDGAIKLTEGVNATRKLSININTPRFVYSVKIIVHFTDSGLTYEDEVVAKHSKVRLEITDGGEYAKPNLSKIDIIFTVNENNAPLDSVTETTEEGWSFLKNLDEDADKLICLKAFLDIPYKFTSNNAGLPYVMLWERSTDGVDWTAMNNVLAPTDCETVLVADYTINNELLSDKNTISWNTLTYRKLSLDSLKDIKGTLYNTIYYRPDCLVLDSSKLTQNQMYRCSIYKTKLASAYNYLKEEDRPTAAYVRDTLISSKVYTFNSNLASLADVEYVNPYSGNVLYYKKSLYAYGEGLDNVVYVSAPDSAMFPITNVIDLSSVQDAYVTSVIPWRDYLMISTENSIHLASRAEIGYTTKILNTFVGIPEHDSKTGSAILNGIIFKSGSKIYTMFPNLNAGVETIFNTSEISKPVEHILNGLSEHKDYKPFAITTSDAYNLFIPCSDNTTVCLKYMFTQKRWTCYEYPVLLYRFDMLNADDICIYGRLNDTDACVEYMFNKDSNVYADKLGDVDKDKNDIETPIKFFLDSGQKTDNISITKQFVESKIIASTQSNVDNFNMDIRVDIDGNTFEKHIDVNTDGAFLRNNSHILSLNTSANTDDADILNTFRQMFLRYSGKGKTIRHIISGESVCPFKIYEVFFRYKYLNVKQ